MKHSLKLTFLFLLAFIVSCSDDIQELDDTQTISARGNSSNFNDNFSEINSINIGGEGAAEITAFDPGTNRLFVINVSDGFNQIEVLDISNIDNPISMGSISPDGIPNSVAVNKGRLAVALENANNTQANGTIDVYDTETLLKLNSYAVGALPDMVTFSPNGQFIVSANEGEPNDEYTIDPLGTISIIRVANGNINTLDFTSFNGQEANLEAQGFRVFGPGASLAQDVEPEFVAISDDSRTAWVTLQENNGMAKVDLLSAQIEAILPFGTKDFSLTENSIDPSNEDGERQLRTVPVSAFFQPDAIDYVKINGVDYVITANEGDSRDYDGFSEEERVGDLNLDPNIFPDAATLQLDENLGRLRTTNIEGDSDGDGDIDEIFAFGARSFTIWTADGQMVFDSGNDIAEITIGSPNFNGAIGFGDEDSRSDDRGAEPEAVEVLRLAGNKYLLFVGLERTNQVLVYDISNPTIPQFLQILSRDGDEAPEGVLAIEAKDSPTGNALLVVSNEDSGTVTFYEAGN